MNLYDNKGFLTYEEIKALGLPILDYKDDQTCKGAKNSWFTYSDLKKIFKIYLTDDERRDCIQAFEKVQNGRGYVPLYCFVDILQARKGVK